MEDKICCCFGHREVYKNISDILYASIENLIVREGITTFMTGGMGEFDGAFASAVRALKCKYTDIRLLLVKPYFTSEMNVNKDYYISMYDEIIIPDELTGIYPKAAITKRNRWMVENSEVILSYVYRDFGGAYAAVKYAKRLNKRIISVV